MNYSLLDKLIIALYIVTVTIAVLFCVLFTGGLALHMLFFWFRYLYLWATNKPEPSKIWFEDENVIMRRVPSNQKNMEALWPYVTVEHKKNDRPYWVTKDKRKQNKGY